MHPLALHDALPIWNKLWWFSWRYSWILYIINTLHDLALEEYQTGKICQDTTRAGQCWAGNTPPAEICRAGTTTHEIRTAGRLGGGFHLGHEECRIATIMSYLHRPPANSKRHRAF